MISLPRVGWLNAGLGLALVGSVAAGYVVVTDSGDAATVAARTVAASLGSVTATISGSGNVASSRTANLGFAASGTVTAVSVQPGDTVKPGQVLASVDDDTARRSLSSATAELAAAQASYDEVVAGQTDAEETKDRLAVEAAELSVDSAAKSLTQARQQLAADTRAQDALVARAKAALAAGTGTQADVDAAVKVRSETLAKDEQSVASAQQQVAQAENQLAQQEATVAANADGPTDAEVAQARVSVESAEASVADAEAALAGTTLRAPFAATVISVAGVVGDEVSAGSSTGSSSTGSSSSGSSSSGEASSGEGSATGGTGETSSGTSSSTSSTGSSAFIVVADPGALQVTANVAEADIGAVEVGQAAQVSLAADDTTVSGRVTQVSPAGTASDNVVQYPVTVALTEAPEGVRLGSSASVTITTGSASDVVTLLSSAITTTGDRSTVTVVKNGVRRVAAVETGLVGGGLSEIRSGLAEGDTVALPESTDSESGSVPGFGGPGGGIPGAGGGRP